MTSLRALARCHRALAMLLVAAALAMKALVPAGYMPVQRDMVLTIAICADATGTQTTRAITVPRGGDKAPHAHDKPSSACHFAAAPGAAFVPAFALSIVGAAIAVAQWHGPARIEYRPRPVRHLRPPAQAPPA